jgi:hypothetical protein
MVNEYIVVGTDYAMIEIFPTPVPLNRHGFGGKR